MSKESKNQLKIKLSCGRCNFSKNIVIIPDKDGVFTIPNKFCPNDLNGLSRTILESSEQNEDKTESANSIPRHPGILEVPKNGDSDSKKT